MSEGDGRTSGLTSTAPAGWLVLGAYVPEECMQISVDSAGAMWGAREDGRVSMRGFKRKRTR